MRRASATTKGPGWPVPAVLTACYLLASAGCHPVDLPSGPSGNVDPSIFEPGDPNRVQVKATRLRSTPGGCEVDVTSDPDNCGDCRQECSDNRAASLLSISFPR